MTKGSVALQKENKRLKAELYELRQRQSKEIMSESEAARQLGKLRLRHQGALDRISELEHQLQQAGSNYPDHGNLVQFARYLSNYWEDLDPFIRPQIVDILKPLTERP